MLFIMYYINASDTCLFWLHGIFPTYIYIALLFVAWFWTCGVSLVPEL